MKVIMLAAFAIMILGSCVTGKSKHNVASIAATELLPFGRTGINHDSGLELISSGAHFSFSFEGKACRLFASISEWQDHNFLQYELDGVYEKRLLIQNKKSAAVLINAASEGHHVLKIYKATEAHTGPVFVQKIEGRNLQVLKPGISPVIEFIGNSITCGAAADPSEFPCGQGSYHDQHNAYLAYGPRLAGMLKTNFLLSSVSGIGVYRNWNSEGPTMPEVYEKTDFQRNGNRYWDFSVYHPTIVSIALGTNDLSNGDGKTNRIPFDSAQFVNKYINFVQLVKTKYPQAQIALLSSPMAGGHQRFVLQNCLSAVKNSIDILYPVKPIALYFFKPMKSGGCSGHPNVDDHRILAEELREFFQSLLQKQAKTTN